MPTVSFVQPDGSTTRVTAPRGRTIKDAATDNLVPGIIGECGGSATCGTCHAYVDEDFLARRPPADENEEMILEGVPSDLRPTSRLTCQLRLDDDSDDVVVEVPATQF